MTPSEIESVENACSVRLPGFYRSFLLAYPNELAVTYTYFSHGREFITERQFRNAAPDLIELHRHVRDNDAEWTEDGGPWPDRYFVIGDDACGGYFAIDLTTATEEVFYYEHELGTFLIHAESLAAFATQLISDAAAWNVEEEPPAYLGPPPPHAVPDDPNQLPLL